MAGGREQDFSDFEEWYRRARPRLVGALLWVGGSAEGVYDAVDEACARALARWDRVGQMESPTAWTYTVALDVWRRHSRRAAMERRLLHRHRPSVHEWLHTGETWELLRSLPNRERTAVALRYVVDLTEGQIAEVMGVGRSTVAVLLSRAHKHLAALAADEPETIER